MLIQEFIAKNKNWETLLSESPYFLKMSRDNGYILFKYNQICSDFSNPIVKEARGVILRESDYKCVSRAFDKFFNAEEEYAEEIDWKTARVQEKIDGSIISVWFDNGIHISTSGTIDAYKADSNGHSFGEIFELALHNAGLSIADLERMIDHDHTVIFELTSKYNRVVVPYDAPELHLIGERDLISMRELGNTNPDLRAFFDAPKEYPMSSYEEVRKIADEMPWDEEGFVVVDANYRRVKIKSPAWLTAHYVRGNSVASDRALIEIIMSGEKSEFLVYAEEYREDIERLEKIIRDLVIEADNIRHRMENAEYPSRKEFAMDVLKEEDIFRDYLFRMNKYADYNAYLRSINSAKVKDIIDKRRSEY